ncbi:MAG: STAS domain-containing protein [Planctomycetaceae bacterium]|nr:STAS domain-containing protein [Planctomycetaceae bacterium]
MSETRAPEVETQSGVTVIHLGREYENLDESLLDELRSVILDVAETAVPPKVVLALSHTKFFGSAFIEIMFRAWKRVQARGGTFAISGLTEYCAEIVEVTHLDRLWTVYADRKTAVAAMAD